MVTLLLTSVLLLGFVAIAAYFYRRLANRSEPTDLPLPPPPPSSGLFSDFRINELRVPAEAPPAEPKINKKAFEEAVQAIRDFQQTPDKNTATKLLHIAALTDDANNYGRAVELLVISWREGSLAGFTACQLQELINSEYWVLSSPTRSSGAGFVLKQTLSTANRELEPNNNP